MANRILRDITDSEKVNKLSWQSEVLLYRLMMKADDYGCLFANPKLLKGSLYPLKESIRETDIIRYLKELEVTELIILFEAENKGYLQILNFGQELRRMKHKYPTPSESDVAKLRQSCPLETETRNRNKKPKQETENLLIEEKISEILNSEIWLQDRARIEKLSIEKTKDFLIYFLEDQKNKDELEHRNIQEIKFHFCNWLIKNKDKRLSKKENEISTSSKDLTWQ